MGKEKDKPVNLSKRTKKGNCSVKRCGPITGQVFTVGKYQLCEQHAREYAASPPSEAATAPPPAGTKGEGKAQQIASAAVAKIQQTYLPVLAAISITDAAGLEAVGQFRRVLQTEMRELQEAIAHLKEPAKETLKRLDAYFAAPMQAYPLAIEMCKRAMDAYIAEQREQKAQLLEQGQHEAAIAIPEPQMPEGTHERKSYHATVTDPKLVPPEYWTIDYDAIDEVVQRDKMATSIPGVEVHCTVTTVTARAR